MKIKVILMFILIGGGILFLPKDKINQVELKKVIKQESIDFDVVEENIVVEEELYIEDPSPIKVNIYAGKDINTTIQKKIELNATIDNINRDEYIIWKEDNKVIGRGLNITKEFSLGEHLLSVQLFDKDKFLGEDNITITAYKYLKKENYYFDMEDEQYNLDIKNFFDHHERIVLEITDYYKKEFTYNESGRMIEEHYERFDEYYAETYTITYNYSEEGVILSIERVNSEGEILESHIYDDEGREIVEENIEIEINISHPEEKKEKPKPKPIEIYNEEGNLTHMETFDGLYVRDYKYDEQGRLIYAETTHPRGKNSVVFNYDSEGKEIYKEYNRHDKDGNIKNRDILEINYNEDDKMVKRERQYFLKEDIVQHTIDSWNYKDGKVILHDITALVGVCPCTANTIREQTIYSYDKNGNRISTDYKYQRDGDDELKKLKKSKIIKTYTNNLD
jgi:hypothetical protein